MALAVTAGGCSSDIEPQDFGSGFIMPSLNVYADVVIAEDVTASIALPQVPTPDEFRIILIQESTGRRAVWNSISDFSTTTLYRTGDYTMTALYGTPFDEGFDSPYFIALTPLTVSESSTADVRLDATLGNTVIEVGFADNIRDWFADLSVVFHSEGGDYLPYPLGESRPLFLRPGNISISLAMTLPDGRTATVAVADIRDAKARHYYHTQISAVATDDADGLPDMLISFNEKSLSDDITFELDPALFDAAPPTIRAMGFDPAVPLPLPEGTLPARIIAMEAEGGQPLQSLLLTTQSHTLLSRGWPEEIELLELDQATTDTLAYYGLKFTPGEHYTVDYTEMLPNIRFNDELSTISFILTATGSNGSQSEPMKLTVTPENIDVTVISAANITIGRNSARLRISAPGADLQRNLTVETATDDSGWTPAPIDSISGHGDSTYDIVFKAPEGTGDLDYRLLYCGQVKAKGAMRRVSPTFSFEADAFAARARLRIKADEPELLPVIVNLAEAFSAAGERLAIVGRDPREGMLTVTGLNPSSTYDIILTLFPHPEASDFRARGRFTTERDAQIPNSGFEETRTTIRFDNMLSGGSYSQNFVEIFNSQNRKSWKEDTPRYWATVNAKTFCSKSANKNTWYMQPSATSVSDAIEGGYAVKLTSVAWDIDGEPIPPYAQQSQPFTDYSLNIPRISNRSAGRLFLGSYDFNPQTFEESYTEGIAFGSRPTALNGYYKYAPCESDAADRGYVRVEVLGRIDGVDVTIARNEISLPFATGYTAFNVPLDYPGFGIRASQIRVMFASSDRLGNITSENTEIITVSDPRTSSATGGQLWLDGLSLSY